MENKIIEKRLCRYLFSENEKREIAQEMANGVADLQRLEDQKKSIMSQLKSDMDSKQAIVSLSAEQLRSGFEMREIDCVKTLDYLDDVVRWVRCDTGEVAFERRMRSDERQMKLDEGDAA